jgi:large subunit ribosomal protein L24
MKIKRGDMVVVIGGDQASRTPHRVTQVVKGGKQLLVEGVNRVFKHVKRGHPKSPQGGRLNLETPIDTSKVMFYCGSCNRGVRVGFRLPAGGSKERFCKSCGAALGSVGRSKSARREAAT